MLQNHARNAATQTAVTITPFFHRDKIDPTDLGSFVRLEKEGAQSLDNMMFALNDHHILLEDFIREDEPVKLGYVLMHSSCSVPVDLVWRAKSLRMFVMLLAHPKVLVYPELLIDIYNNKKTLTSKRGVTRYIKDWLLMTLGTQYVYAQKIGQFYHSFCLIFANNVPSKAFFDKNVIQGMQQFSATAIGMLSRNPNIISFLNQKDNFYPMYPERFLLHVASREGVNSIEYGYYPYEKTASSVFLRELLNNNTIPSLHFAGFLLADPRRNITDQLINMMLGDMYGMCKSAFVLGKPYFSEHRKLYVINSIRKCAQKVCAATNPSSLFLEKMEELIAILNDPPCSIGLTPAEQPVAPAILFTSRTSAPSTQPPESKNARTYKRKRI